MATNRPRSLQIYDPVLTNLAKRYKPQGFIARELLPSIPTSKLSGQYPTFTKQYWFQNDVDTLVADRAGTKEIDYEWSMDTYLAKEHALKVGWSDLEADQADAALRFEATKTEYLTHRMELAYEVRVAALLRKTTNGGGLTGGAARTALWSTVATDVEPDIKTGVLAIYDATGQTPNVIVIPYKVAYALALNTSIRNLLSYQINAKGQDFLQIGDRIIPSEIHGMKVIIPRGAQLDTSREGGAESISEIWGDEVRLLNVNASAGWGIPSCAYRIEHTAKKVTRWRTVDPDLNYVREMERYDLKVVAPELGYEISDTLT